MRRIMKGLLGRGWSTNREKDYEGISLWHAHLDHAFMNKNQHLSANIPAAKNKIQIKEEQIMCDPKELGHLIHQISQEIT